MAIHLKCWHPKTDYFARDDKGGCQCLQSTFKESNGRKVPIKTATRFNGPCPFYKTAEEAGGTYEELRLQYPLYNVRGEEQP